MALEPKKPELTHEDWDNIRAAVDTQEAALKRAVNTKSGTVLAAYKAMLSSLSATKAKL